MHPTLIKIGPLELHAYGLMLALAFFVGIWFAARRAPRRGVSVESVYDTSLAIVFAAIVGARLMYVVFHREEIHSFFDILAVWRGGLTMYGGVIGAMFAAWFTLRRRGIPFLRMADVMAPSLGLGLFLTRIGCFLNGCCYGKPTDLPWGVSFPSEAFGGRLFGDTPLHPAQLYSSLAGLLILLVLLLYDRRPRAEGRIFSLYLILAGAARFALDFVRSYEANVYILGPFTVNQMISVGSCLLGLLLLGVTRRADGVADAVPPAGEAQRLQRSP